MKPGFSPSTQAVISRRALLFSWPVAFLPGGAQAKSAQWAETERTARGQTVYFNAWAGNERINAYLQWAAAQPLALVLTLPAKIQWQPPAC